MHTCKNKSSLYAFHEFKRKSQPVFFISIHIFNSYIWRDSKLDTPEEKRWTWLLVLLSLWPQWQAIKLIKRIFKYKRTGIYRDNEDLKRQSQVIEYRTSNLTA